MRSGPPPSSSALAALLSAGHGRSHPHQQILLYPPRTFTWAGVGSGEHRVWVGPHPQQPSGCPHQPSNKTMCCPPPPRPPRCPTRVGSLTHHVRNCVYTHCWMPHATWERREGGQPRVVACCVGGCGGWPPLLDILNSVATPPCHPSPPPSPRSPPMDSTLCGTIIRSYRGARANMRWPHPPARARGNQAYCNVGVLGCAIHHHTPSPAERSHLAPPGPRPHPVPQCT